MILLAGNTLNAEMMKPNGTRFDGWLLNAADNVFRVDADLEGDVRRSWL